MADTTAPTLFTDPTSLPEDARQHWASLLDLTSQREFNQERVIPGAPMPPLHQQVWQLSDQLFTAHAGFLHNRMLRANLHLHQQALPEAEAEARFVVQHAPCSEQAHSLLKRILALRGALEEGKAIHAAASARCEELPPYEDALLFLQGDLRYLYPEAALSVWTQHLSEHPQDAAVTQACAELLLALDQLEDAQRVLERGITAHPDSADLRLLLGSLRAEMGDLANAQEDFEFLLAADPYHGKARMHLARVHAEVGDMKTALKLLKEGAEENTGDPDYCFLLGQIAMALEQHDLAGTAFVRALAADLEDEEDVAEAEDALRNMGLWHDGNVRLQYLLAERALNAGDGLRAISHLSLVQQAGVDTRELHMKMAEAHHAMGLLDDPLNFLVLAKSKKRRTYDTHGVEDPSDGRLDLLMLSILLQADYPKEEALPKLEAHKDMERSGRGEPESYFLTLADCWARVGEFERANAALRLGIERNPLDPLPWMELATLLESTDQPGEAVRAWRQVWDLTGPDPDVAHHLAACYEQLGALPWAEYCANRAADLEAEAAADEEEDATAGEESAR